MLRIRDLVHELAHEMDPESAHWPLCQGNVCVRLGRARRIERLSIVFRFDDEKRRIDSTPHHDLRGAAVSKNVREVLFQSEVRRIMNLSSDKVFATEIFQ